MASVSTFAKCVLAGLLTANVLVVDASFGDRTVTFQTCREQCLSRKCAKEGSLKNFYKHQPVMERLLWWSCEDECSYTCMWKTVDGFMMNGMDVPQFYGKWPFVRFMGVQEPASMVFSVLNGLAHLVGLGYFLPKVHKSNPLYKMSVTFGMVAINTWIWSTVFHMRDFGFTEKMDYFCATGSVLFSLYFSIYRISMGLNKYPDYNDGKRIRRWTLAVMLAFFTVHVCYLSFIKFDYGYNMLVTTLAGLCSGAGWIFYHWKTRKHFSHQWKATFAVCYTSVLLLLELQDFPPIWWTFDAHSIWHASTVFFPALWYPFLVDESQIFAMDEKYA